jgi:hypothetical protein
MVQAIMAGTKTQTRRPLKAQPDFSQPWYPLPVRRRSQVYSGEESWRRGVVKDFAPWKVGDRLWVRETWRPVMESYRSFVEYRAGGSNKDLIGRAPLEKLNKVALRFYGARKDIHSEDWHPSILMPRWASRINLEVLAVRVERLHEIDEAGAQAEGVPPIPRKDGSDPRYYRQSFAALWDGIYGTWDANPWVWVTEFRRAG